MGIDFRDEKNKSSYMGREVDPSWLATIRELVDPTGKTVLDLGCGGGVYSRAWVTLGAKQVIGMDFSPVMLDAAAEYCRGIDQLQFYQGDATAIPWPEQSVDIVFARALVHHLADTRPFVAEAYRVLKPGGVIIVQDRTHADVDIPGSAEHIRGFFFESFPRLLDVEMKRRPQGELIIAQAREAGFSSLRQLTLWETRKIYASSSELADELRSRKGRSILHELDDHEVDQLARDVQSKLPEQGAITEKDRWTIWCGERT
ncbi:class I SAM-dependent methyltransferase [Brevibacillus migulae]|uniref:class I SAM-dependent methyltransferase n=1 Tax=Brevibacillus migulae TaxID=1644114 RepID=UPI00106E2274|nr:class I SAM-dependent methyltransferase [Brevibacillus migulae]